MSATESSSISIPGFTDVMSLEECATFLRVPPETILQEAQAGHLPGRKLGELWRFSRSQIHAWLGSPESLGQPGIQRAPKPGSVEAILQFVDFLPKEELEDSLKELSEFRKRWS
jgi:excisionase family DNA binding protein